MSADASEVWSAQCRSSKASTTACVSTAARIHAVIAASCRRRNSSGPIFAARSSGKSINQWREQQRVFGWVQADQFQSVLEVGQALFGRQVRAEAVPAPFGDRMQRRILQQLRRRPLDPGVQGLAQAAVKLLHQPGFARAGLASDQRELALALVRALPAPGEKIEFLLTPDEGVRARAPPRRPPPLARTTR